MELIIIGIYTLSLLIIFAYSLSQLNLLFNFLKEQKNKKEPLFLKTKNKSTVPFVTIQLPLYNELYVVERLLDNIAKIDYPKTRLEIQVLDDSTDESIDITAQKIKEIQAKGIDIHHIFREKRTGFKAGALKYGLEIAKGEFIAIFDADFLPNTDFLRKTIPYFTKDVGVVQTRWGHLNRNHSIITRVQAFGLDAHFTLEQVGRNSKGHFINFNGTAGIWRKSCIIDAGNWEGDTLTEDLDLSYRAQLKGWKFNYLENILTPAELPITINAARSQQFRWNKGGAENFIKMSKKVVTHKTLPLKTKIHAILHLLNSSMFLNVLLVAILSIPMLYIKEAHPEYRNIFLATSLFTISTLIFFICYWFVYKHINGSNWKTFGCFIKDFLTFFTIALGFSLQNSIAILEAYRGKKSAFIRTPKFNVISTSDKWKKNKYIKNNFSFTTFLEGIFTLYFLFGLISAFVLNDYGLFVFHLMLFIGFGFVFTKTLQASFQNGQ